MAFLIVEAFVPVTEILTCMSLKSVGGAAFRFLFGLVSYYLSFDTQTSYIFS